MEASRNIYARSGEQMHAQVYAHKLAGATTGMSTHYDTQRSICTCIDVETYNVILRACHYTYSYAYADAWHGDRGERERERREK
eukprot:2734561-Pyramimonas_sp.AAC.1